MAEDSNAQCPPLRVPLSGIRSGNEDAIHAFVDHYEPHLRRVLRVTKVIRLLQSQLDSQDLIQSVFIQVIARPFKLINAEFQRRVGCTSRLPEHDRPESASRSYPSREGREARSPAHRWRRRRSIEERGARGPDAESHRGGARAGRSH